ncbi:erythromycin esterase family protein [Streptomyces sp. NPDC096176]|uniref:erythromycin esterase family protein n=1 Tax=Streptomyces sp. NPDC096176 TaxID=3366079 RepID=UPI0037FE6534
MQDGSWPVCSSSTGTGHLYSLYRSVDEVISYLERVDPAAAARARERYACFDHYRGEDDARAWGFEAAFSAGENLDCPWPVRTSRLPNRSSTATATATERSAREPVDGPGDARNAADAGRGPRRIPRGRSVGARARRRTLPAARARSPGSRIDPLLFTHIWLFCAVRARADGDLDTAGAGCCPGAPRLWSGHRETDGARAVPERASMDEHRRSFASHHTYAEAERLGRRRPGRSRRHGERRPRGPRHEPGRGDGRRRPRGRPP